MSTDSYDMGQMSRMLEAHGEICPILQSVDTNLLNRYLDSMMVIFPEIFRQEHINPEQFVCLKEAYGAVAKGAMKHIDSSGIPQAIAAAAPMFGNFSFEKNKESFLFDTMIMNKMGISFEQIDRYWGYIDEQKDQALKQICEEGFNFESRIDPIITELGNEQGGEEWMHLSPGWFTKIVGAVIVVANATTAVPSCGLSVASIVVGGVGVLAC